MRSNQVKAKLKAGQASCGTWLSLGNQTAARFLARTGFDWLTVDIEHSLVGMESTANIFGAVADAGCTCLARVPANRHDHIKRVLDNGAHGVVVPMVITRQEAEDAVAAMLYPPRGNRSVGGSVHALNFEATAAEYYARADDELLIVLQCEHIKAVENFESVYSVGNVDAVFVGPNDLAASMRSPDGKAPSGAAMKEALDHILKTCIKMGIAPGIHAMNPEEAKIRLDEGWRFIAVQSELRFMMEAAANALKTIGLSQTREIAKY